MATTKAKKIEGFKITVQGQYYAADQTTGRPSQKFYKGEVFEFPAIVTYVAGKKKVTKKTPDGRELSVAVPDIKKAHIKRVGLHLITRYYIEERLREKYDDFVSVRRCEVFKKEAFQMDPETSTLSPSNIPNMRASDLLQFIAIHDLTVTLSNYFDLGDKKLAVEESYREKKRGDIAAGVADAASQETVDMTDPDSPNSGFGIADEADPMADLLG